MGQLGNSWHSKNTRTTGPLKRLCTWTWWNSRGEWFDLRRSRQFMSFKGTLSYSIGVWGKAVKRIVYVSCATSVQSVLLLVYFTLCTAEYMSLLKLGMIIRSLWITEPVSHEQFILHLIQINHQMISTNTVWPAYTAGWLISKFIHWTY